METVPRSSGASGTRVAGAQYEAWGENRGTLEDLRTSFRFTGQRKENIPGWGEGLYFYNARWYDPALSRFLSADSIIPNGWDPVAWDRYAYVRNSPAMYTDPSGHRPCDQEIDGECISEPGWYVRHWSSLFYHRYAPRITTTYDNDDSDGTYHPGIDYSLPVGTTLYASGYGIVIVADECLLENGCEYSEVDRDDPASNRGYGNVIVIEYPYASIPDELRKELGLQPGESLYMIYAHLDEIFVSPGDVVYAGQPIGTSGDTGNSTAGHLHLAVKIEKSNYMEPGEMCGVTSCYPGGTSLQTPDDEARYGWLRQMHNIDPTILDDYYTMDLIER